MKQVHAPRALRRDNSGRSEEPKEGDEEVNFFGEPWNAAPQATGLLKRVAMGVMPDDLADDALCCCP
jgi:hypothetical protein